MTSDEAWRAWSEVLSQWGAPLLSLLGVAIGIAMASAIVRGLKEALRTYFETEKLKAKPKRTGEKLKRGDGEVLDVIHEKRKNDANHR